MFAEQRSLPHECMSMWSSKYTLIRTNITLVQVILTINMKWNMCGNLSAGSHLQVYYASIAPGVDISVESKRYAVLPTKRYYKLTDVVNVLVLQHHSILHATKASVRKRMLHTCYCTHR